MCMKREYHESDKAVYPWPALDFIDLTMDDFPPDDVGGAGGGVDLTPRNDQWNYPYNPLPSSDEEEPVDRSLPGYVGDNNEDFYISAPINGINENRLVLSAASLNYSLSILDTIRNDENDGGGRGFALNIPQILLSMTRISDNLRERAATAEEI